MWLGKISEVIYLVTKDEKIGKSCKRLTKNRYLWKLFNFLRAVQKTCKPVRIKLEIRNFHKRLRGDLP